MKKIRYYLDTAIFNLALDDFSIEKKQITKKFLEELTSRAENVYISDEVVREISRCEASKRSKLEELLKNVKPLLLEIDKEVEELAELYIKEGIIPRKYRGDALHIAVSVVNGIEVIVSWNFEHIVKLKTRIMVNGINKLHGYHEIEICSPEEVIEL